MKKIFEYIPLAACASILSATISAIIATKLAQGSRNLSKAQADQTHMTALSMRYNAREMGRSMMLLDAYRKHLAVQSSTTGIPLLQQISKNYDSLKANADEYLLDPNKESLKQDFEIEIARRTFTQHYQAVRDLYENATESGREFKVAVGPLCGKVALLFLIAGPMKACSFSEREFSLLEFYCRECKILIEKERKPETSDLADQRLEDIRNIEIVKSRC